MAFWNRKQEKPQQQNDYFGDDGREMSVQMRKIRAEKNKLLAEMELMQIRNDYETLKAELSGINSDTDGDLLGGNNTLEPLLLALLTGALKGKGGEISGLSQTPNVQNSTNQQPANIPDLSPDEINGLVEQIPRKYLKLSKKFDDNTIKNLILKNFPAATTNDLNNILIEIRNRA